MLFDMQIDFPDFITFYSQTLLQNSTFTFNSILLLNARFLLLDILGALSKILPSL